MPLNPGRVDPRVLPQIFAWYSADAINGFFQAQPAADAAIAQWNDLSGNGRHLLQGTGANQPLYRVNGGPNNGPSVQFMDNTDVMSVANAAVTARPNTLVAIMKNTVADDAQYHRCLTFNNNGIALGLDWITNNIFGPVDNFVVFLTTGTAGDTTTYHLESFVAQPVGGLSRSGVDGTHVTAAGQAGTNTDSNIFVGNAGVNFWSGHVCEAIVFTGEINNAIMFALEQSLAERWNLFTSYKLGA